ncbi:hypothetical protein FDECE_1273 [Fusarium decemcellulare]|nr:hypothetical protein FDECE_1273 [Fusarium decemcellulare]
MSLNSSKVSRWAILIGVGGLRGHENQNRSVKGAVGDIIAMKKYLDTCSTPIQVRTLTTQCLDQGQHPTEALLQDAPTRGNVTGQLKHVIEHGHCGDHVYIHFSGHGTSKQGSLALVLYEPELASCTLLYGAHLRTAINLMVSKGMLVTLVLDCCFSGSVLRNGYLEPLAIRYIEYDTTMDTCFDHIDPFAEVDVRSTSLALPKGGGSGQRLLDPAGYSVLSACDLHEAASEVTLPDGSSRGALSYFLLDSLTALRNRGVEVSHHSLHQYIRGSFHARHSSQTPMLYGGSGLSFFNDLTPRRSIAFVSAHRDIDSHLVLDAGEVHGVHIGNEYALYAFTAPENSTHRRKEAHVKAIVDKVNHFTSELRIANPSEDEQVTKGSTWKAEMLTTLSPSPVRMMLMQDVPNAYVLSQEANDIPFLHLVLQDDQTQHHGSEKHSHEEAIFHVVARDGPTYEVLDQRAEKIENFPPINSSDPDAIGALLKALGHIAAYKFFERIENLNPDPGFERSFSLICRDKTPGPGGIYTIEHGEPFELQFKNLDTVPKYLAVLDFDCSWEVSNPIFCGGEGYGLTIGPKDNWNSGEKAIPLKMVVPSEVLDRGQQHVDDTIKIFITSRPTMFPAALLPQLGHDDLRDHQNSIKLIKERIWGLSEMRGGGEGSWSTQTFFLRTKSKPSHTSRNV